MNFPLVVIGDPADIHNPRPLEWLLRSKSAALVWTAMRVWLGIMWIQTGIAKIWGAENPAFLHHDGAGVKGFALHATPAYTWWGHFLHGFVAPNSGWIGILIAVSELAIGIAIAFGILTPIALLGSLLLLFTYVMSGTASVCAFYALFAFVLLAMWRTASWIGVDGLVMGYRQNHYGSWHLRHGSKAAAKSSDTMPAATPSSTDMGTSSNLGSDSKDPVSSASDITSSDL